MYVYFHRRIIAIRHTHKLQLLFIFNTIPSKILCMDFVYSKLVTMLTQ